MKKITSYLALFILVSCVDKRSDVIFLTSKDKSQTITILSDYQSNERIIANGKRLTKPNDNYVFLNIEKVTEAGDEFGICWNKNGWQIVNENAKIVVNKLNPNKYIFKDKWYRDKDSKPNTKFYIENDCFTVHSLNHLKQYPIENGYVERQ